MMMKKKYWEKNEKGLDKNIVLNHCHPADTNVQMCACVMDGKNKLVFTCME